MKGRWLVLLALLVAPGIVNAAEGKGIRFWNLTAYTMTSLQLSPSGEDAWGANQCENDKDGSVDHDERLKITGVQPIGAKIKSCHLESSQILAWHGSNIASESRLAGYRRAPWRSGGVQRKRTENQSFFAWPGV